MCECLQTAGAQEVLSQCFNKCVLSAHDGPGAVLEKLIGQGERR